jgi:hypothetical protein
MRSSTGSRRWGREIALLAVSVLAVVAMIAAPGLLERTGHDGMRDPASTGATISPTTAPIAERVLPSEELRNIASSYLREHHPDWTDGFTLPDVVYDCGEYWVYTYELPKRMLGGTPVVLIDKKTRAVIRAYHEQ